MSNSSELLFAPRDTPLFRNKRAQLKMNAFKEMMEKKNLKIRLFQSRVEQKNIEKVEHISGTLQTIIEEDDSSSNENVSSGSIDENISEKISEESNYSGRQSVNQIHQEDGFHYSVESDFKPVLDFSQDEGNNNNSWEYHRNIDEKLSNIKTVLLFQQQSVESLKNELQMFVESYSKSLFHQKNAIDILENTVMTEESFNSQHSTTYLRLKNGFHEQSNDTINSATQIVEDFSNFSATQIKRIQLESSFRRQTHTSLKSTWTVSFFMLFSWFANGATSILYFLYFGFYFVFEWILFPFRKK
eukprot:TRINITY_DN920_c0_g4_i1.p1 TRINITY_DN920_c0_g4~~TRINITY_DN920_c0_g4_i1.p1  ORF type:complete len:301 (+),score=50.85 TRINITY_DN920_c0_g4_i1:167-1069(+)